MYLAYVGAHNTRSRVVAAEGTSSSFRCSINSRVVPVGKKPRGWRWRWRGRDLVGQVGAADNTWSICVAAEGISSSFRCSIPTGVASIAGKEGYPEGPARYNACARSSAPTFFVAWGNAAGLDAWPSCHAMHCTPPAILRGCCERARTRHTARHTPTAACNRARMVEQVHGKSCHAPDIGSGHDWAATSQSRGPGCRVHSMRSSRALSEATHPRTRPRLLALVGGTDP